jgi:hypothetical protein
MYARQRGEVLAYAKKTSIENGTVKRFLKYMRL